jgi:16S rRNA processing protein RimM
VSIPEYLVVGRIRKPHGVRGEVIVEPITDEPAAVFAAGRRLFVGSVDGDLLPTVPPLVVEGTRPFGELLIARFGAIADRTEAERWRGRSLLLPGSEVEPPGEGEAWVHELIGMQVELVDGSPVGELLDLYDLPQGLIADVRWRDGMVTIPLSDAFLREIDREGRRVVLDLPEGLLE